MKPKVSDYINLDKEKRTLFQCRVRKSLLKDVQWQRETDGITWSEMMEGLFKFYLDYDEDHEKRKK